MTAPVKPPIDQSLLDQIDVRVGTILRVEDIPDAARLVRLLVSFGDHQRQIISGMKQERQDLPSLEGRQALFVVNLQPRAIRGQLSEGLVFDLGFADGIAPALAVPERAVPDGTRAG